MLLHQMLVLLLCHHLLLLLSLDVFRDTLNICIQILLVTERKSQASKWIIFQSKSNLIVELVFKNPTLLQFNNEGRFHVVVLISLHKMFQTSLHMNSYKFEIQEGPEGGGKI